MTALSKQEDATATPIYFSDFFNVATEVLEEYGAFNVSLINDLPLFIDPFLLFNSEDEHFKALHEEIIRYVKFLRDVSVDPNGTVGQAPSPLSGAHGRAPYPGAALPTW